MSTPFGEHEPVGRSGFPPYPVRPELPGALLGRWLRSLEVTPLSATKWECRGGWSIDREVKGNDVFYFLGQGEAVFEKEGGGPLVVEPGCGLFVSCGTVFSVTPRGPGDAVVYALHFLAKVLHAVDLARLLPLPALVRDVGDESFYRELCREFAWRPPGWEQALRAGITGLIVRGVRLAGAECRPLLGGQDLGKLELVAPALQFIESNLERQSLQVGDIAETVGMSTGHFRRVFQQATGQSPVHWIQKRRIELACVLLRNRDATVREIAERCGFKTETFFYSVFQKWTGKTPRGLRAGAAL